MAQIFCYILHKDGVVDDTALELAAAAQKIDADTAPNAIVVGSGDTLDAVCNEVAASFGEVWKVANDAVTYPGFIPFADGCRFRGAMVGNPQTPPFSRIGHTARIIWP